MTFNPILNADLMALVDASRLPTDSIWQTHDDDQGAVTVFLITDLAIEQAKRMIAIGLAGGEGRTLQFRKINGAWALASVGRWIA